MSYSDFSLSEIKKQFEIRLVESEALFSEVEAREAGEILAKTLADGIHLAHSINTEKARSEMIIAPILMEVRRMTNNKISLFSGIEFTVDKELGLTGYCDFILSRSEEQLYVTSPVLALVEAKNENIKSGIPQCIAEMIAARKFNEAEGDAAAAVYGCVTTGTIWKFLQLDDKTGWVDWDDYYIDNLGKLLGVLLHTVGY